MKKFIVKRILPWMKENVKIEVEAAAGKINCVEVSVYIYDIPLVKYQRCKVQK